MSKEIQLGKTAEGKDVAIQLDRLIESRMLVQANSGEFPADFDYRKRDMKGGLPNEWPEDLRVREFPEFGK